MFDQVNAIALDVERDAQRRRAARDGRDPEHGWAWDRTPVAGAPRRPRQPGWLLAWRRWRLGTAAAVVAAPE